MTNVVLVGPPSGPLADLQRVIDSQQPAWSVLLCPDGDAALRLLEQRPADVAVAYFEHLADYETLFAAVSATCPGAVRLALFHAPPPKVRGAHQTLATRGDLADLYPIVNGAASVAARISRDQRLRRIVSDFQDVPSPPLLYFDLRDQLASDSGTARSMATIAGRDPALVARTLSMANSGFYARPRTVADLADAIGLIGGEALMGLVLAAHLYTGLPPPGLKLDLLWQHSMQVSALARDITRIEGGSRQDINHSFLAGLLHDIGLMVLLENESSLYQPILQQSSGNEAALARLEVEAFGITHGELGALILMLWNLPPVVVDAVAGSHTCASGPAEPESLAGRALMAAEWLLDKDYPDDLNALPAALAAIPENSVRRWFEARDALVAVGA